MKDNKTERDILATIKYHRSAVNQAQQDLIQARGRRLLSCGSCLKWAPVRKWAMFEPYGGAKAACCPNCGVWNHCQSKEGRMLADKYGAAMLERDPYRAIEIPGDWVNV